MRLPAVAALLLALAPGCLDAADNTLDLFEPDQDCTTVGRFGEEGSVPLVADVDAPAAPVSLSVPRMNVTIRAGQMVLATAAWAVEAGEVQVVFDGPVGEVHQGPGRWASNGGVANETRDYSIELRGAPLAVGVAYAFTLIGLGCTPVEGG